MKVLERLRQEKSKTVIAILHDLNLASAFCNKLILMMAGKVFAAGETRKVLTPENLKSVYDMEFELIGGLPDDRQYIIAKM